jgi:hypothetical protein
MEDPNKLTVAQLKTKLINAGVDIPASKQSKAFYVELYKASVMGKSFLFSQVFKANKI